MDYVIIYSIMYRRRLPNYVQCYSNKMGCNVTQLFIIALTQAILINTMTTAANTATAKISFQSKT